MIWFEWKKILNGRVLLCFVVIHLAFLMLFWTQNSSVQKGRNTAKQQEIYQKIGGRLTASTAKEIEELKQRKDAVLEEEAQKEDEYAQGKISVDEYMKYRDEYHMMNDKNEAIDSYYDQLFRMDRTQWGLMLSVFLLIVLLVCCEPKELLATISVTREGRRGLWGAKLRTILMATLIFVILFAVEELMVIRQFSPLSYLDAPIQSISCLAGKHITISIAHWYLLTLLLRVVNTMIFAVVTYSILYFIQNKKVGVLILAVLIFGPVLAAAFMQYDTWNILAKWIMVYPVIS